MMLHAHATPGRRIVRPGDFFAIDQAWASYALHQAEPGAFFWLFAPPTMRNERYGDIEVVGVNGPLEYHDDGCGDSYESIVERIERALRGESDDGEDAGPPEAVILRIDSPGGVVAGLSQTVAKIREMRRAADIPLAAYFDETGYSAAMALACACDRRYLPRSGMCGSIGVISTLVDQTGADKKAGLRFAVLSSGSEKADGHPHVPITNAMLDRERPRVEKLAMQFFQDVRRATGLSIDTIRGFQARRFLGVEAVRAKVADGLLSWDEMLGTLTAVSRGRGQDRPRNPAQSQTKPLAQKSSLGNVSKEGPHMELTLDALIARTEAAIASEKDPSKLATLGASLEAYKKTKHSIEKHETEEGDEDEEDEEDDAAEEEGAKGDETDRGDEEDNDEDEDEDEDEDDSSKSKEERKGKRAALIAKYIGKGKIDQAQATALGKQKLESVKSALGIKPRAAASGPTPRATSAPAASSADSAIVSAAREITKRTDAASVVAALRGLVSGASALQKDVKDLQRKDRKSERDELVSKALSGRRISKATAKMLGTKKLAFVTEYLEMHKSPIVSTAEDIAPSPTPPGQVPTFAGAGVPLGPGPGDIANDPIAHAIASAKAVGVTVTREQVIAGMAALNGKSRTPEV